jgi:hypothetical protein
MTIPAMGFDGTYQGLNMFEIPYLKVYDDSNGSQLDVTPGTPLQEWMINGQFQVPNASVQPKVLSAVDVLGT